MAIKSKIKNKSGRRLTEEKQIYLDGLCSECELQIMLDFSLEEVDGAKKQKSEV